MRKKNIPTYNIYKTLNQNLQFVYSKLEDSYNTYDASMPHRHNYFEILFFTESGGVHEIDFKTYEIKKNAVHFVCPDQVHLLLRNNNVNGAVISFTPDLFLNNNANQSFIDSLPFLNTAYAKPVLEIITKKDLEKVQEIIENIETEFSTQFNDKLEVLQSYLSILLLNFRRFYYQKNSNEIPEEIAFSLSSDIANKYKKLVDQNYIKHKSVKEYAETLCISSGHLNDTVQKEFGKTASEIIHERIILEAKRLLYRSPKSIKEIASDLHYQDASYFSRFFKIHAQQTPEAFRKHIREKYQ